MKVEFINATNYANIYALYDESGKPLGEKEVILAGRNAGVNYYSLSHYSRSEIKKLFREAERS